MQTWVFTADRIKSEGGSALYISTFQISLALEPWSAAALSMQPMWPPPCSPAPALAALALIAFAALSRPVPRNKT